MVICKNCVLEENFGLILRSLPVHFREGSMQVILIFTFSCCCFAPTYPPKVCLPTIFGVILENIFILLKNPKTNI